MLNPFPTMWLALLAFFILRIAIGITLLQLGYSHFKRYDELVSALQRASHSLATPAATIFITTELGLALLILAGYHTQYAALIGIAFCLKMLLFHRRLNSPLFPSRHYYILLTGALLSLFITGAGIFAFDLPI